MSNPKATRPATQTAPAPAPSPAVPETPLEVTNPAGPREGVEQPSGPPEGHDTPVGTDTTQPTNAEVVDPNLEISIEDPTPEPTPLGTPDPTGEYATEALRQYLAEFHPAEVQEGVHPAYTALRLLTRLGAKGDVATRCQAPYCNLPEGHRSEHGWVHVEPGTAPASR